MQPVDFRTLQIKMVSLVTNDDQIDLRNRIDFAKRSSSYIFIRTNCPPFA